MPKYFFSVETEDGQVADPCGIDLNCLADAYFHAMRLVYVLRTDLALDGDGWIVKVTDERGDAPLTVLSTSIPGIGSRAHHADLMADGIIHDPSAATATID